MPDFPFATRKDLLTSFRETYPGAYDQTPDEELYGAVIEKYPVYAQQVEENFKPQNIPDPALPAGTAPSGKVSSPLPEGWVGRAPKADLMTVPGGKDYLETSKKNLTSRRGFIESLTDVGGEDVPFAGDFFTANKIREALTTYKKMDKGEEVTDEELVGFNNWLATSRRMENATWKGKAGDVIRGSIKFWAEIGATTAAIASPFDAFAGDAAAIGSLASGKAAKKLALEAGESFLKKEANRLGVESVKKEALSVGSKLAYNRAVNEAGYKTVRSGAYAAVEKKLVGMLGANAPKGVVGQTAVKMASGALVAGADIGVKGLVLTAANPGLVQSKIAGQQLRQYLLTGTEDQSRAVVLGLMDAFNENASEMAGYTAGKALGLVVPAKVKETMVKNTLFRIAAGKVGPESAQQWMARAGFHGMLEEMYEERVAGFASGLLGLQGDDRAGLGKAIEEMIPSIEQMKTEALAFSLPGIAMASAGYARGTEALGGVGWKNLEENLRNITLKINAETKPEERVRLQQEYDDAKKFLLERQKAETSNPGWMDRFMKAKFGTERVKPGSVDDLLSRMNMERMKNVRARAEKDGQDPDQAASDYVDNFLGKNAYIVENEQRGIKAQALLRSGRIERVGSVWATPYSEIESDPTLRNEGVYAITSIEGGAKLRGESGNTEGGVLDHPTSQPLILDELSLTRATPSKDPDDAQSATRPVMAANEDHPDYGESVRIFGKAMRLPERRQAGIMYDLTRELIRFEAKRPDGAIIQVGMPHIIRDTAGNIRTKAGYALDESIPNEKILDVVPRAHNRRRESDGRMVITLTPGARPVDLIEDYLEAGGKRAGIYNDPAIDSLMAEFNVKAAEALKANPKNPVLKELVNWGKDPAHQDEFVTKLYISGRLAVNAEDRAAFAALQLDTAHIATLDALFTQAVGKPALDYINKSAVKIAEGTPAAPVQPAAETSSPEELLNPEDVWGSFSLSLVERIQEIKAKPLALASTMGDGRPSLPEGLETNLRRGYPTNHASIYVTPGDKGTTVIRDEELGLRVVYSGGTEKLNDAFIRGLELKLADAEMDSRSKDAGFIASVNTSVLKTILQYETSVDIPPHLVRDLLKTGLRPDVLGEWFTSNNVGGELESQTPDVFHSRFAGFKSVIAAHFEDKTSTKEFGEALAPFYQAGEWTGWQIPEGMTGRAGGKIDRLGYTRGQNTVTMFLDSSPYQDGHQAMPLAPVDDLIEQPAGLNPEQKARLSGRGEQGPNDLNVLVDGIDVAWNSEKGFYEYIRADNVSVQYEPLQYDKKGNVLNEKKGGLFRNKSRTAEDDARQVKASPDVGLYSSVFKIDTGNIATNGELIQTLDANDEQPDEDVPGGEDASADLNGELEDAPVPAKVKEEMRLNQAVMDTTELEPGHEIDRIDYDPKAMLKDQGIQIHVIGESAASGLARDLAAKVPKVTPMGTTKVKKWNAKTKSVEMVNAPISKNNPIKFQAETAKPVEANAPQFSMVPAMLHNMKDSVAVMLLIGKHGIIQDTAVASRYRQNQKGKFDKAKGVFDSKAEGWTNRDNQLIPDGQPASQGFYSRLLEYAVNGTFPLAYAGETMDQLAPQLNTDFSTPYKSRLPMLVIHEGMTIEEMSAAMYSFMLSSGAKNIVVANFDRQKTDTGATPGQWLFAEAEVALIQALNVVRGTDRVVEDSAYDNGIEYRHVKGIPYVELSNGTLDALTRADQNDIERRLAMQPIDVNREVDTGFETPNLRGKPGLWDPVQEEPDAGSFSLTWDNAVSSTSSRLPAFAMRVFNDTWNPIFQKLKNEPLSKATPERLNKIQWPQNELGRILRSKAQTLLEKKLAENTQVLPAAVVQDMATEQAKLKAVRAAIEPDADTESDKAEFNPASQQMDFLTGFSISSVDSLMEQLFPYVLSGDTSMLNVLLKNRRNQKVFLHDAHITVRTWQQAVGARPPHGWGMFKKWDGTKGKLVLRAIGARIDDPKATYIPLRPGNQLSAPTAGRRAEYEVQTEDTPIDQILADYNANRKPEQPSWEALTAEIQEKTEVMRQKMNAEVAQYGEKEWIAYLENYITHRYLGGNKDKEKAKVFAKRFAETTNREEARQLPTYTKAVSLGLTPMTLDAAELYGMWAEDVGRVVLNKLMMNAYAGMTDVDGSPLLVAVPTTMDVAQSVIAPEVMRKMVNDLADYLDVPVPAGTITQQLKELADRVRTTGEYKEIDSPFESLSQIFVKKGQPYRYVEMFIGQPWKNAPVQFLERLNGWMKFMALGVPLMSFFHPFSLLESFIATIGLHNNPVITGLADLFRFKRPRAVTELTSLLEAIRKDPALADPWIEKGMELNFVHPDIAMGMIDKDITGFIENVRTHGFPASEHIAKGLESFLGFKQKWDNWLWNTFQPTLKLHTAQGVLTRRLEEADRLGEYVNKDLLMEDIARYMNDSYGGQEWETYWFATPKFKQLMHLLAFAPDWTISSANSAGLGNLPIIKQTWAHPSSDVAVNEMIRHSWPAMLLIVLGAIPAFLQFSIWALTRPFGDPDDQPLPFMNEAGKETHVDITPLLRMTGYKGGETGHRRIYLRWGKQAYEVIDGWLVHPFETAMAKSSQLVKLALEQATGTSGGGWDLPFKDAGLLGALRVNGSFMDSRVGYIVRHFSPYVLMNVVDGYPVGYFAPASRGNSKWSMTNEMQNILEGYADDTAYDLLQKVGKVDKLKERVADVMDNAARNGYVGEEVYTRALALVRTKYYGEFFKALNSGDQKETEQLAGAIVRLNGNVQTLETSMSNRFRSVGKEWSSELLSERVRAKFE